MRKHGFENFKFSIIDQANSKKNLENKERYWIIHYDSLIKKGKGYNISDGGYSGNVLAGKTKEEINKIGERHSKRMKGNQNPMYGKKFTEEHRLKIANALKKYKGSKAVWYGRKHSQQTKNKISSKHSIRVYCETTNEKFENIQELYSRFKGIITQKEIRIALAYNEDVKGFKFKYLSKRKLNNRYEEKSVKKDISGKNSANAKQVYWVEKDLLFETVNSLRACLKNELGMYIMYCILKEGRIVEGYTLRYVNKGII